MIKVEIRDAISIITISRHFISKLSFSMINICLASVVLLRRSTLVGGFLLATCIHDKKLSRHVARILNHMFLLGL